jgi:hypothetical protein
MDAPVFTLFQCIKHWRRGKRNLAVNSKKLSSTAGVSSEITHLGDCKHVLKKTCGDRTTPPSNDINTYMELPVEYPTRSFDP